MPNLQIEVVPVTPIKQNCRLLWIEGSSEAIVVDPGGESEKVLAALDRLGLTPVAIWLTHSHLDHCGGVAPILQKFNIPFVAHSDAADRRGRVEDSAAAFNMPPGIFYNCPEPTQVVLGGETLAFGGLDFQVFYTPGHCPGHIVFYQADHGILLAGDTLFKGSIGRTDFPDCDHDLLIKAIREVLFALPDETQVLSGHGPDTTIGAEKATNPYV